jgi:hypothetical protein
VLFVDGGEGETGGGAAGTGSGTGTGAGRRPTFDWPGLAARVVPLWADFRDHPENFADEAGLARAVSIVDLFDDVVDVTPARHVRATAADIDPESLAREVSDLYGQLRRSVVELGAASEDGEWKPAGKVGRDWRSATLADLARGGALTILRGAAAGGRDSTRAGSTGAGGVSTDRRALTARDVATGSKPSGADGDAHPDASQSVAAGDVLVRAVSGASAVGDMTRVADESDAGAALGSNLHLLRPDPARLDPWFLAGFLGAADNIAAASTGSTLVQVNPGRLRVPLMPLAKQRRYGDAFRRAHELRVLAQRTAALVEETAAALTTGLTAGALLPPTPDDTHGSA